MLAFAFSLRYYGQLSYFLLDRANKPVGPEVVLSKDWCYDFASHSIGDIVFGTGGDDAMFDKFSNKISPNLYCKTFP